MPAGTPFTTGHYGSVQGVRELRGSTNVGTDWDIDADGNVATIAIEQERALTAGDNGVNLYLAFRQITPPAIPDKYYYVLQDAANRIATVTSYRFRGEPGANGKVSNPYQFYLDEAREMLDQLVNILRPSILPGVFTFVPTADPSAATSTDEFSAWWW